MGSGSVRVRVLPKTCMPLRPRSRVRVRLGVRVLPEDLYAVEATVQGEGQAWGSGVARRPVCR